VPHSILFFFGLFCGFCFIAKNRSKSHHYFFKKGADMQVSMQEFKSHLAQYVGQAQSGQVIELTSHRKVVARLVGVPTSDNEGIARLLATGRASWQGNPPKLRILLLNNVKIQIKA
jgi:prevent-host-death family protein